MKLDRPVAPNPYDFLPPVPPFVLQSDDIADGQPMHSRFAFPEAGGKNISPALRWSGFPERTRSFGVTCFDPDAPTASGFWHWCLAGLPTTVTGLSRGAGTPGNEPSGAFHVRNDYGTAGYGGAAPPEGDRPHRYFFVVHALDSADFGLNPAMSPAAICFNYTFHVLARAVLCATYQVP